MTGGCFGESGCAGGGGALGGVLGGDIMEVEQAGAIRLSSPSSPVTHGTLGPAPAPGRRDLGVHQPGVV